MFRAKKRDAQIISHSPDATLAPDTSPVKDLLHLAASEWKILSAGCVFLFLGSAGMLLFPKGLQQLLDLAPSSEGTAQVNRLCLDMLGLSLGIGVLAAARQILFGIAAERVMTRLRNTLYKRLLHQDVAFFDLYPTGMLLSCLTTDVTTIRMAVTSQIAAFARNGVQVAGGIALLLYTSPALGAGMLVTMSLLALMLKRSGRRVRRFARAAQASYGNANALAQAALQGIHTVRVFGRERYEFSRYAQTLERGSASTRRGLWFGESVKATVMFGSLGTLVLLFWYGARMVQGGTLTTGQLTSFFAYGTLIAIGLNSLGEVGTSLSHALAAADRVFSLMRSPRAVQSGSLRPERAAGAITFEAVRFRYRDEAGPVSVTVDELRIAPGQRIALVGRSGAGKSTLAALIAHLYDPQSGRILFDGHDLRELDANWLRAHIAVVPQRVSLFAGTIAENIAYGRLDASPMDVEQAAREAGAHEFINALPEGYQTHISAYQLSGGEQQRIAIARALVRRPKVLILDEATAALDSENEQLIQHLLARVTMTTITIAHRLSTVIAADRILVLEQGRIVQQGTHAELAQQAGEYRRLVNRQHVVQQVSAERELNA